MALDTSKLKFTKTHEWLRQEHDEVIIGITDHAQQLLGDMVFIELPEVGDIVSAGDEVCVVESVKAASDVYAPISGEVIAVNEKASEEPAIINSDPYEEGWLIKLKPTNPSEIETLLNTEQYHNEIAAEDH